MVQITDQMVRDYQADGVVLIRGLWADWVEELRVGIEKDMADPTFQMVSITDRAVTFYNRIVERAVKDHPELLFSALAYVQYTRPPVRERPHKNLVIQFAPITYSRAHPMDMDAVPDNIALRDIVAGWGKASQAMSYYFYAYYLADPVSTAPFLRKWAVDIPYIYKNGSCRYWQPETMGNNEFFFMAQPGQKSQGHDGAFALGQARTGPDRAPGPLGDDCRARCCTIAPSRRSLKVVCERLLCGGVARGCPGLLQCSNLSRCCRS